MRTVNPDVRRPRRPPPATTPTPGRCRDGGLSSRVSAAPATPCTPHRCYRKHGREAPGCGPGRWNNNIPLSCRWLSYPHSRHCKRTPVRRSQSQYSYGLPPCICNMGCLAQIHPSEPSFITVRPRGGYMDIGGVTYITFRGNPHGPPALRPLRAVRTTARTVPSRRPGQSRHRGRWV